MTYPKLFIQHIPKTGLTSVLDALRKIYGKKNVQRVVVPCSSPLSIYIRDKDSGWNKNETEFVAHARLHLMGNARKLNKIPVLHGHHPYSVIKDIFPDRQLITWVRDPIALALSWFSWDLGNPDKVGDTPQTIDQYLRDEVRNNIIYKMTRGSTNTYDFIGITEHMRQDWTLFCHWYGLPVTELPRRNVQPIGYDNKLVQNPNNLITIKYANRLDFLLYGRIVKERFSI